ncbi:MAG TPA: hypothetical protein DC047_04010 [Blastocatellia bacterium]|nr:hypothetical protein [Blastocatellia bacterium]
MLTAVIGFLGVLLGIFLNEYFRRRNRIELYSKEVFRKRLSVYEELHEKIQSSYAIAQDVMRNPVHSNEQRHAIWSNVVLNIAAFTDKHGLYLNENLIVHCMTMLIGIEDIYSHENPEEREGR